MNKGDGDGDGDDEDRSAVHHSWLHFLRQFKLLKCTVQRLVLRLLGEESRMRKRLEGGGLGGEVGGGWGLLVSTLSTE